MLRSALLCVPALLVLGCRTPESGGSPFVCNLNALDDSERARYTELTKQLAGSVEDLRELSDGYALRIAMPLAQAAEWAEFESRCCPFFDIRLEQVREGGPRWLHLTGREGVKQFIREEFGL